MDSNKVVLRFKNDISNLAGYDFGLQTYRNQVKDRIDIRTEFVIVFPDQIKGIASSFVQGFFSEIVSRIGLLKTEERVVVKASSDELANSIIQKLE